MEPETYGVKKISDQVRFLNSTWSRPGFEYHNIIEYLDPISPSSSLFNLPSIYILPVVHRHWPVRVLNE